MTIELVQFVTALGHATNILKAAIDARDESKRREALADLNGAFAEVQSRHLAVIQKQLALLEENEAIKKQIGEYDKWEQEKTRYSLRNVGAGTMVRAFDPDKAGSDALHWLCAHCYEARKKGFLQRQSKVLNHYKCDSCGLEVDALKSYPSA